MKFLFYSFLCGNHTHTHTLTHSLCVDLYFCMHNSVDVLTMYDVPNAEEKLKQLQEAWLHTSGGEEVPCNRDLWSLFMSPRLVSHSCLSVSPDFSCHSRKLHPGSLKIATGRRGPSQGEVYQQRRGCEFLLIMPPLQCFVRTLQCHVTTTASVWTLRFLPRAQVFLYLIHGAGSKARQLAVPSGHPHVQRVH